MNPILISRLKKIIEQPWFIALVVLGVFFQVNQYRYGWDDQHLEIPLLKHLIDPTLYAGDYYVESLAKNFSSFFYPILSKLISVDQIPPAYFFLYVVSRYFLFFWTYKIWLLISENKFKAFCCCLTFILVSRVNEFLYRTFSHQEFALALIVGGIYYFFKQRYYLAAIILGIAANFHALYSAFPMVFMGMYLLIFIRQEGAKKLFISSALFLACASPFIIWTLLTRFQNHLPAEIFANWEIMYRTACPQNFMFPHVKLMSLLNKPAVLFQLMDPYIFLLLLFLVNLTINERFKKNNRAITYCLAAFGLLFFTFLFTHIYPIRFVVDLNSIRNTQFLSYLLMGFTTLLIFDICERKSLIDGAIFIILFSCIKYGSLTAISALGLMLTIGLINKTPNIKTPFLKFLLTGLFTAAIAIFSYGLVHAFNIYQFPYLIRLAFIIIVIASLSAYFVLSLLKTNLRIYELRKYLILIPLAVFFIHFINYRTMKIQEEQYGAGYWSLHRSYEDMQRFVKAKTPKNALFLVPHNMEMENFRTFSERKIIASYRDCGIVGFDYKAVLEWRQRLSDIESFKVYLTEPPVKAIQNALAKYHVDYIVFMRYMASGIKSQTLQPVYHNKDFALYKVVKD